MALCLRCPGVVLAPLPAPDGIEFFRCPQCERDYAQVAGRELTFRWGSAISLVLYPIIFSHRPQDEAERVVALFVDGHTAAKGPEQLRLIIADIRAELAHPTQRLRDILPLPSTEDEVTEDDLREYLRRFADRMEAALG